MRSNYFLFAILLVFGCLLTSNLCAAQCTECELVISVLENMVVNNASEAEIMKVLDYYCQYFGYDYNSTCESILENGLNTIISYINNKENPMEVCTQIGECTSMQLDISGKKGKKYQVQVGGAIECGVCKTVIEVIEKFVDNNSTEDKIEAWVDNAVCNNILPGYNKTCDAIANAGIPQVINWIVEYQDPAEVCTELTLCDDDDEVEEEDNIINPIFKIN